MPSDEHFSTAKINTFWKFIFQKMPKLFLFPFANIFQITPWVLVIKNSEKNLWFVESHVSPLFYFTFSEVCKFLKSKSKRKSWRVFPEFKWETQISFHSQYKCKQYDDNAQLYFITFQNEILGCYKPTHLKMNLALEIWVGQKIGVGGIDGDFLRAPRWLPPLYDGFREPCKT